MSGMAQRERDNIAGRLLEWKGCDEPAAHFKWIVDAIKAGEFSPPPEPPAGTGCKPGCAHCDAEKPAPQPDHLAKAIEVADEGDENLGLIYASIAIAQTLRVVSAHLSRVGSEMEWARIRGGKP
jgi:hypothetical protein